MAALLASRRSSEDSLSPLDWHYSPDSWHSEDDLQSAESSKASGPSPLLHGALFCGDVVFPMTREMLLSISPKLHDLVFTATTATDASCGQWSYDLDDELQDVSSFLEAGSRNFMEGTAPYPCPPTIREESTFEEVSAIIHLSRKYGSAHLYHSAVEWLERHFTPDAAHFDVRTPPAVFACCRLPLDDLVNGYIRDDRGKETLSLEDIVRVRVTRDRLVGACKVFATCVYTSKGTPTCRRRGCRDSVDMVRQKTVDALRGGRPSQPMMRFPILQRSALEYADAGLCEACTNMVEAREREARKEIWGLLPCVVDEVVPGWAGRCPKHCPSFEPSEPLSDSDSDDSDNCCTGGRVHDWMHYRRTCS
ncbi:hypothetical protein V8D89_008993 [Ganoderma adspersum]